MLAHGVVDNRAEHLFDFVRVERPRRSRASNKQQVCISPQIDITTIEPVEGGDHDHEPLAHAALEEFASDIIPLVQPVVDLPHLLYLSIGIFYRDSSRELLQRLRHIVRKQHYSLRWFSESFEELVHVLKQCWKVA